MKKIILLLLLFNQTLFAQNKCTDTMLPIVFVHGYMGSGDNWSTQIQRFTNNGFCAEKLFVFDWNSIGGGSSTVSLLNNFIDSILIETNASKVNLVGHSAGGGVCYSFLKDSLQALKVANYVHIGSAKMKTAAGNNAQVPTMNIYSTDDLIAKSGGDIKGAINVKQTGNDHMQVATSAATFKDMFAFFTGVTKNVITTLQPSKAYYKTIGGKGVVLAENKILTSDSFRVNLFNPKTGEVIPGKKTHTNGYYVHWTNFGSDGRFSFAVPKDTYLEFEVKPKNGRTLFYYFEPIIANNKNVYVRSLPTSGMAAAMLKGIPNDDVQTALVIFSANNAIIAGRDSLAIDSIPLSVPSLMPASKTAIACFLYDDGDKATSANALKSFSATPFLSGVDVFIKADPNKTMRIYYKGRNIVLPKRKSKDGVMIVVFN
jgi:triacylglycerol esterase/lipase EstA (alpha/beta hydrolase family)